MASYIIRKMARIHCARGPKNCKKCKEFSKIVQWAILDISPSNHPLATRPMIEVDYNGEKVFQTFDVVAYFDDIDDAKKYAEQNEMVINDL